LAARETAHLIGYLGEINKTELAKSRDNLYRLGDFVGRYGLEFSRERILHGAGAQGRWRSTPWVGNCPC
jgi:penicillin-binding protein 2